MLKDEVGLLAAIDDMKNNKAEGVDNIPAEMLKNLGEKATGELVRLCQDIYNTGKWPEYSDHHDPNKEEKQCNGL